MRSLLHISWYAGSYNKSWFPYVQGAYQPVNSLEFAFSRGHPKWYSLWSQEVRQRCMFHWWFNKTISHANAFESVCFQRLDTYTYHAQKPHSSRTPANHAVRLATMHAHVRLIFAAGCFEDGSRFGNRFRTGFERGQNGSFGQTFLHLQVSWLRLQGPYLYRVKYSSFGRHFTTTVKLETVTSHLMYFLRKGDCCVDFSCGSNEFLSMLEKKSAMAGLGNSMSYVGFDILPASIQRNFVMKSWFDVRQHDVSAPSNSDEWMPEYGRAESFLPVRDGTRGGAIEQAPRGACGCTDGRTGIVAILVFATRMEWQTHTGVGSILLHTRKAYAHIILVLRW